MLLRRLAQWVPFLVLVFQRWLSGGEDRCSYKMHSLTQDRTGRQTALGYDALNEGPAGSGGEIVWSKEVTGEKVPWQIISGNVTLHCSVCSSREMELLKSEVSQHSVLSRIL